MTEIRRILGLAAFGFVGAAMTITSVADAHWCNDLWISRYNISVRPATDTVTVPSGGQATLDIFVRNDMGYPLKNFGITATSGSCQITTALASTLNKPNFLLPAENAKYTLTIKGCTTLQSSALNISVKFGDGQCNGCIPVVLENAAGAAPGNLSNIGNANDQALQLGGGALADWGSTPDSGLDKLLGKYCAGRACWDSGSGNVDTAGCCPNATTTTCKSGSNLGQGASKFDFPKLWSAGELAIRKSALGSRAATLRDRLKCGMTDAFIAMSGYAAFVLGYLGEDAGARTTLEDAIAKGGDLGTISKAAILLMGNAADKTKYEADVTTCANGSSVYLASACAAALGIVNDDDAIVKNVLFKNSNWQEPDTGQNGAMGIYSSYLLEIVAWDRRAWAAKGASTGTVSFYGEGGGTAGAGGAAGASGAGGSGGVGGSSGGAGTSGSSGQAGTAGAGGAAGTVNQGGSAGLSAGGAAGSTGGAAGSAGTTSAGGSAGTAGTIGTGGIAGSAGSSGGNRATADEVASGCSCSTVGGGGGANAASLLLAGLAGFLIRRRRRQQV